MIIRAIPLHNRLEYLIIAEDKCVDYKKHIHLVALVRGYDKSDIMNELFTGMMATVQSYANSSGFLTKFIKLVWLLFETLLIQIFYISASGVNNLITYHHKIRPGDAAWWANFS